MKLLAKGTFFSFAKIGFIGLGNMGMPMATNLVKKGHQVFGFDIILTKHQEATQKGIVFRKGMKELAKDTDTFITMLPSSQNSRDVCEAEDGLFKNASADSLIIDGSTILPEVSLSLHKQGKKHNMTYVDAPVSGGILAATAGTLTFMVGAEDASIYNRVKTIAQDMGKNFFHCGGPGVGQIAKVCNNLSAAINMVATCESLALGTSLGMDPKILSSIMSTSTGCCWTIDTYNPAPGVKDNVPASRDYQGGFASELMLKDVGLGLKTAESVNSRAEMGEHAKIVYEKVAEAGLSKKDFGVVYQAILDKKL